MRLVDQLHTVFEAASARDKWNKKGSLSCGWLNRLQVTPPEGLICNNRVRKHSGRITGLRCSAKSCLYHQNRRGQGREIDRHCRNEISCRGKERKATGDWPYRGIHHV